MPKNHKTVSSLQNQLKSDIVKSIENKIMQICVDVIEKQVWERVYKNGAYIGNGEDPYQHTLQLYNSVTVANLKVGTKYVNFEVFMDAEKIDPYVRKGVFGANEWNAHASVDPIDVSEYIPLWLEEGTNGSLYDHEGAHYMEQSYLELEGGKLARELADALRGQGWRVIGV